MFCWLLTILYPSQLDPFVFAVGLRSRAKAAAAMGDYGGSWIVLPLLRLWVPHSTAGSQRVCFRVLVIGRKAKAPAVQSASTLPATTCCCLRGPLRVPPQIVGIMLSYRYISKSIYLIQYTIYCLSLSSFAGQRQRSPEETQEKQDLRSMQSPYMARGHEGKYGPLLQHGKPVRGL